jgi:hypothetical protein
MTWATLGGLWDERDSRYRYKRPQRISADEAELIRAYRQTEIALLPADQRRYGVVELARWKPPSLP